MRISRDLILKKSEHNEKTIGDLEEIALHQLQIEKLEVIGNLCRRLKILLIQDNAISKMENLHYMKDLEYLNLGMNNITIIEGLRSCEFLNKLDLTLNFINFTTLEKSVHELSLCRSLKELHLIGNLIDDWQYYRHYIIAKLPLLENLDGTKITHTERLIALKNMDNIEKSLSEKIIEQKKNEIDEIIEIDTSKDCPNTPSVRLQINREAAEMNAKKEETAKNRLPKKRDDVKEHAEALQKADAEETSRVMQRNDLNLPFKIYEDEKQYHYQIQTPKFLNTDLITLDIHPHYFTLILKNKTLRLCFETEIISNTAKCQRSSINGKLHLTLQKAFPSPFTIFEPLPNTSKLMLKQKLKQPSKRNIDEIFEQKVKIEERHILPQNTPTKQQLNVPDLD